MKYLIFIALGIIIGCIFMTIIASRHNKPSGAFVIDLSDPMKDVCTIELGESIDSIYSKKRIILDVRTYGDISPN